MAKLPDIGPSPTAKAIYASYEAKPAKHRAHLGASLVGKDCCRELWYSFRWCAAPAFPGRILRMFQTGYREEPRACANLRAIGCTVHEVDPATGKQWRYELFGGHFGGSMDGAVLGVPEAPKTWHLLEIKTSNAKGFRKLELHGVKKAQPAHWVQMQVYMGLAGLTRALYFMVNKDTDALYTERIHYDKKAHEAAVAKAKRVIGAPEPLTRVGAQDSFGCKWCDYTAICHEGQIPPANCRTCAHSTPVLSGGWTCAIGDGLTFERQLAGCDEHLYIPALLPWEVLDAGDGWVEYSKCVNVAAAGFPTPARIQPYYSSAELAVVDPDAIGDPALEKVREELEGKVV